MPEFTTDQIHFLWFAIGLFIGLFFGIGYMVSMKAIEIVEKQRNA